MGLFRRRELTASELKEMAVRALGTEGTVVKRTGHVDTFAMSPGRDGKVHDTCWFCGAAVEFKLGDESSEIAVVMIEPVGSGPPLHGVCHTACAARSKGSLDA